MKKESTKSKNWLKAGSWALASGTIINKVITVIPGYINTLSFKETGPKFLIASPEKAAKIIYNGIKKNKEIIYINMFWKFIMKLINFIPEKNI